MPDDRLIHRTIGHSAKINALTDFERLVWLMYKLASDDYGVMRLSAVTLRDAAEWLSGKPERAVQKAIERVRDVGLVQSFAHQGKVYIYQHDWQTWQKITYPRQTIQPAPPLWLLDRHTQWLFAHHPKGGKLKSWQAPEDFRESLPELSRNLPGTFRPCVCVGVCVCAGKDQNLPTPKARRDSRSVDNLLKTGEGRDEAEGLQADRVSSALCGGEDAPSAGASDRRRRMEGEGEGPAGGIGIRGTRRRDAEPGDDASRVRLEADDWRADPTGGAGPVEAEPGSPAGASGVECADESSGGLGDRRRHDAPAAEGLAGLRRHIAERAAPGSPRYH